MGWFIRIGRFRVSTLNLVSLTISLCFILAWFSRLGDYDMDKFFSADCLYLPSVYQDLLVDGHALKGWNFNPAPNFFPDMLLYFILMAGCGNSIVVASFLFSLIQVLAIFFIMARLFRFLLPDASTHWFSLIFLLLTFFIMEYMFFTREYFYSFYMLSNAFHTGSFVMAVLCLWMSLNYFKKPSVLLWLLLLVIGFVGVVSDRLFLVLYTAPAFVSVLFLFRRFTPKQVILFISMLLLSVLLGLLALNAIREHAWFNIDSPHKLMAFDSMKESYDIFSEQIGSYLTEFSFKSITICLTLASFMAMIVLFVKVRKRGQWLLAYYIVFSTVFSLLVISAPILNGNYTGYDILRYNIYPLYLMPLNLVLVGAYFLKQKNGFRYAKHAGLVLYTAVLALAISSVNTTWLYQYFSYYPSNARILDKLTDQKLIGCGVANYWDAKPATLFSKKGVRLYAVFDDLNYQGHVANTDWFLKNTFNYLLLKNPVDTALCVRKFGSVQILKAGPDYSLIKVPDFTYPSWHIAPMRLDSLKAR